jgi:hypothetical protein
MSTFPNIDVYAGTAAPDSFELRLSSGQTGLDLTLCTGAELLVHRNGADETWALSIYGTPTARLLILRHEWLATETASAACLRAMVLLTFPDGVRRAGPVEIIVRGW